MKIFTKYFVTTRNVAHKIEKRCSSSKHCFFSFSRKKSLMAIIKKIFLIVLLALICGISTAKDAGSANKIYKDHTQNQLSADSHAAHPSEIVNKVSMYNVYDCSILRSPYISFSNISFHQSLLPSRSIWKTSHLKKFVFAEYWHRFKPMIRKTTGFKLTR